MEEIREQVPELAGLADVLPKTRSELYPFIGLVIAVIMLMLAAYQAGSRTTVTYNQVINYVYSQAHH